MPRGDWSDWDPGEVDPVTGRGFTPLFPADSFVPGRICPHMILDEKGWPTKELRPMGPGERRVCMICHQSGADGLDVMKPDPLVDPKPEPRAEADAVEGDGGGATAPPARPETRRERRARAFGAPRECATC